MRHCNTRACGPEEALALVGEHVRPGALLIAAKNVEGEILHGTKTCRRLRTPTLFGPVRADVAAHRLALCRPAGCTLLFPRADGRPWRETDYRNWRRRRFKPAVARLGLPITRPYDLRHACASLLRPGPRPSVTDGRVEGVLAPPHDVGVHFASTGSIGHAESVSAPTARTASRWCAAVGRAPAAPCETARACPGARFAFVKGSTAPECSFRA